MAKPKYRHDLLNHQHWDVLPKVRKMACRHCQKRSGDIRGSKRFKWAICKECHDKGFRFYFNGPKIVLLSPKQVKDQEFSWY